MIDANLIRKDIEKILEWRKSGKPFNLEQQTFADNVVNKMLEAKNSKKIGVQLVSKQRMDFIKAQVSATQDVVETVQAKDGKEKRKAKEIVDETQNTVSKATIPGGVKPKEVPISGEQSGKFPKKTPDIANIKRDVPENQKEGEVATIADSKEVVQAKDDTGKPAEVKSETIGHNPELPIPQKTAEEVIDNANWGIKIGAYTNISEGIERQLARRAYAEFVDTPEKMKATYNYIQGLTKENEPVGADETVKE